MSRRIEIELTSALDDGTFTWRAAGAKQPKGVVESTVLPDGAKVGDQLKVEVEQTIDGIDITSVVHGRQRVEKAESLELLPSEKEFKPVVETRAPGRRRDGDGKGRRRRDGESGDRRDRNDRGRDGQGRGDRGRDDRGRDGQGRGDRGRDDRGRDDRGRGRNDRNRGPRHAPPPEVPTRPKPKRLKPGKARRNELLGQLPEEQRPIAELTLQGIPAVRQRLKEENERAAAEGRPTMPEATVVQMAESLLPRLRVADWLDRAEAAQRQLATLDLRDLRSVVAGASDPAVARDESTRTIAEELKQALTAKQEEELVLWYGDIDASLAVGRVIRALRLSAQPPKAGVPFPVDIAERLTLSTNAALTPVERPDRWVATLEAAAFSPIHASVAPLGRPETVTDELTATITRLAPALPLVAEAFGVTVDPDAPFPKPLRPDYSQRRKDRKSTQGGNDGEQRPATDRSKSSDRRAAHADKPADNKSADNKSADDKTKGTKTADADAADTDATSKQDAGKQDSGQQDSADETSDAVAASDTSSTETPGNDTPGNDTAGNDTAGNDISNNGAGVEDTGTGDDAADSEEPPTMPAVEPEAASLVVDVIDNRTESSDTDSFESEAVAEASVVAEAEAITEAASEVEAAGGSADDMDQIADATTELLIEQSAVEAAAVDAAADSKADTVDDAFDAAADAVTAPVGGTSAPVDDSAGDDSTGDDSAGHDQAGDDNAADTTDATNDATTDATTEVTRPEVEADRDDSTKTATGDD